MPFIADPNKNWELFDFITGDYYKNMSIVVDRYYYLLEIEEKQKLKVALRDPETNHWTKWENFPGLLRRTQPERWSNEMGGGLTPAVDVHRSLLDNEIVIESDYPAYEQNYEAIRFIGTILEEKGFIPHYYYSGNKSIHIHIFLDFNCFAKIDPLLRDQIVLKFRNLKTFKKKFIGWLRKLMISCWDTQARKFDEDLIRGNHLIRCELSRNKQGYKTFLGYTYKDVSFIPYICNETNRIYPKIGELRLSRPHKPQDLILEFLNATDKELAKMKNLKAQTRLNQWFSQDFQEEIRPCVKLILDENFKKYNDGENRGMFILLNELKRVYGKDKARTIIKDWNNKMGNVIRDQDIEYRLDKDIYNLSCEYIHKFLKSLGIEIAKQCRGKL